MVKRMRKEREIKVVKLQKGWRRVKERAAAKIVGKFLKGYGVHRQ